MSFIKDIEEQSQQAQEIIDGIIIPDRNLTNEEIEKLADATLDFSQKMTGRQLYPYQAEFAWRVAYSILSEDTEVISALFSRQCVPGTALISMSDGSYKYIRDIKIGDEILSLNTKKNTVECDIVEDHWSVGKKKRIKIKNHIGDEIECSPEHKIYTDNGWKKAEEIRCGTRNKKEFIATLRKGIFGNTTISRDECALLGYLIADGSYGTGSIKFTNTNPRFLDEVEQIVSRLFPEIKAKRYKKGNGFDILFTTGSKVPGSNPLINWLIDIGIRGQKGTQKRLPSKLLRAPKDCLAIFLNRYFSSDGWVSKLPDNRIELGIVVESIELAREFKFIFNKFGVGVNVNTLRGKGSTHPVYKLKITKNKFVKRLFDSIGPIFGKEENTSLVYKRKMACSGQTFERISKDVSWGKVTKIEKLEPVEMFDITTKKNHTFICDNIVVSNSGKTESVSVITCGMLVLFPLLAQVIPDRRIQKFKNGLWVGIFAPGYKQSGIMWARMKNHMYSGATKSMLLDPDIDIDLTGASENMVLPNGSFVDCGTAAPQSNIEGTTYHLIILEETQDIDTNMIRSSIHPMCTALAGSIVKIGTCNRKKSDFYETCRTNKRKDISTKKLHSKHRLHFEADYTVASKYNPLYAKSIAKEKERLGYDSDDFRLKYRLHWMFERGMFISQDMLSECGIKIKDSSVFTHIGRGKNRKKVNFIRPSNVTTYDPMTKNCVAAIDVGRENSTVVTVGRVFWDKPIVYGDSERFYIHIMNWLELQGDDHEAQHPQILSFLNNYNIDSLIIDATGKGDPVYARIKAEVEKKGVHTQPFVFTPQSKDIAYKILYQELTLRRITFPAGAAAAKLNKWQKFMSQMTDLEKTWRGQLMVVHKPLKQANAADDYCDSLAMLSYLVNVGGTGEIEVTANPFLGRAKELATKFFSSQPSNPYTRLQRKRHRKGILE